MLHPGKERRLLLRLALIYEGAVLLIVILSYRERSIQWVALLDVLARYLMAVPAAVLAGLALYAQSRQVQREDRGPAGGALRLAGLGIRRLCIGPDFRPFPALFPALILNQESFLALMGFPIQLVRTLSAVIITIGLIRATQIVEKERQVQLVAAHRARLEALEERETMRRDLLQHIVRSQEDERARIAQRTARRDRPVAHCLLAANSAHCEARSSAPDTTGRVDHLQGLTRQMSQGLYRLVHDLRPSPLDDLGLVPALNSLVNQDCREKGLTVAFAVDGNQQRLNPLVETVLFRVAQEALNNVCRHAGVHQVKAELHYCDDQVIYPHFRPGLRI